MRYRALFRSSLCPKLEEATRIHHVRPWTRFRVEYTYLWVGLGTDSTPCSNMHEIYTNKQALEIGGTTTSNISVFSN